MNEGTGDRSERHCVFVYGTLTDPDRAAELLDGFEFVGDAAVEGLHRVEGEYPTLAPGGRVEGRLLRTPELDRLDAYEGVDRGLYVRVTVPQDGGDPVEVYVGDPDRLDADASWPGGGAFERVVQTYVDAHHVRVREPNR